MCVAAIAWCADRRWPLVAIGNRDEFHERPAAALAEWDDGSGIIAGRDLRSGGTWLGVVPAAGRFALVTNLRGYGDPKPDRASRGQLVTDLLGGRGLYADPDIAPLDDFNPFNLLLIGGGVAHFLSNRPAPIRTALAPGIYGLSNGALDEPWPKTLALKAALRDWLARGDPTHEPLFAAMASEIMPEAGLHATARSDVPSEPRHTPPFIRSPIFGTRCSTIIAISAEGRGTVSERRFGPDGAREGGTALSFDWAQKGQTDHIFNAST